MSTYVHGGHIRGRVHRVDVPKSASNTGWTFPSARVTEAFHHWDICVLNERGAVLLTDNGYDTAERAIEECSALVWAARQAWSFGFGSKRVEE